MKKSKGKEKRQCKNKVQLKMKPSMTTYIRFSSFPPNPLSFLVIERTIIVDRLSKGDMGGFLENQEKLILKWQ